MQQAFSERTNSSSITRSNSSPPAMLQHQGYHLSGCVACLSGFLDCDHGCGSAFGRGHSGCHEKSGHGSQSAKSSSISRSKSSLSAMQRPSIGKSRGKEKLLSAGSCYGGDLRRPGPRSQESKKENIYIFKEKSCLCQLMRQYGLNNLRRSQQKIFLASQIGETPSLDALVTF